MNSWITKATLAAIAVQYGLFIYFLVTLFLYSSLASEMAANYLK